MIRATNRLVGGVAVMAAVLSAPATALEPEAAGALEQKIAQAEASLREGELQLAESHYREALREGWMQMGTLARIEGRADAAREAFERASSSAVDNRLALQALALLHLQTGQAAAAAEILGRLAASDPSDAGTRRLLAQALSASGRPEESLRELEQALAAAPGDAETLYALATGYLRTKRVEDAARVFAELQRARPGARTRVLIGRSYRDFGEYARATAELEAALRQDPNVRRAHYYLGSVLVAQKGRAGLEEAIVEFQAELRIAPFDPLTNLELGMALVDTQRPEQALPALELAARVEPKEARTFYYLGRAQLGAGLSQEAEASLRIALELARRDGSSGDQLRVIHNQLGQALRARGEDQEAAIHFAEAESFSAQGSEAARERLARRLAGAAEPEPDAVSSSVPLIESSPLASLTKAERLEVERRVSAALARTYLNLGVLLAQGERFARAAEQLELAARLDPDFPQVQSSLGIAYFNAQQFEKAQAPLSRALAQSPGDADLKRMLALTWLNTQEYAKAVELLRDDPELATNTSLRFAFGLALVKSGQTAQAEQVFARLISSEGDSAELNVLLGKAYAQMGDFGSAIAAFERALALEPDVAEAHAALGVIYYKQGRLEQAEAALRRELVLRPGDLQSRQNLAQVLESDQRPDEALPLLRGVLAARPDFADARYLLGKILLAQGATEQAVEQLEAAVRLAPDEANAHYQLGRGYTALGRSEDAQRQFEVFRQIKAKR